ALLLPSAPSQPPPMLRFTDVTAASGIVIAANTGVGGTNPHAVAVEDFNGDGLPDIIIPTFGKPHVRYFKNLGKLKFPDVIKGSGINLQGRHCLGCTFGDVDGDGLDDLFVTCYQSQASALFKNLGGGKFKEITLAANVGRKASAVGCVFADIFNRGRLDL